MSRRRKNISIILINGSKALLVAILITSIFLYTVQSNDTTDSIALSGTPLKSNQVGLDTSRVETTHPLNRSQQLDLTYHRPIYIGSEQNIIDYYDFPGDGSADFPYVISGYYFNDSLNGVVIDIRSTQIHILIRGNLINATSTATFGIHLWHVSNVRVEDNIISVTNTASALEADAVAISGDSFNCTVANNTITSSDHGIEVRSYSGSTIGPRNNFIFNNHLEGITGNAITMTSGMAGLILVNNTIAHNTITDVGARGIYIRASDSNAGISNSTIRDNLLTDCNIGMEIRAQGYDDQYPGINRWLNFINNTILRPSYWGMYIYRHSFNNIINNSIIEGQNIGLYLYSTMNNTISGNTIFKNEQDGIKLYYTNTANNLIIKNIIANNSLNGYYYGISLHYQSLNTYVINNTIANNSGYGVYIASNSQNYNYITGNDFIDNNAGATQATSRALNTFIYNYWNDWTNPDTNKDGIVDSPYIINADYEVQDPFPLTQRSNDGSIRVELPDPPTTGSPGDLEVEYRSEILLTWPATSVSPGTFKIFQNSTEIEGASWNGNQISQDLYWLNPGWYNFTLWISDTYGQTASNSVMVHIIDSTSPTISSPADVTYEEGVLGNELEWTVSDAFPYTYELYIDEVLNASGFWLSGSILVGIDRLSVGQHNYTLFVIDQSDNFASDTVMVTVTEVITTTSTSSTSSSQTSSSSAPTNTITSSVATPSEVSETSSISNKPTDSLTGSTQSSVPLQLWIIGMIQILMTVFVRFVGRYHLRQK